MTKIRNDKGTPEDHRETPSVSQDPTGLKGVLRFNYKLQAPCESRVISIIISTGKTSDVKISANTTGQ